MRAEILQKPSYAIVEAHLESGESIVADSGAMAWMDPSITTQTSTRGGILKGLKRKLLTGESFFQNTYRAEHGPGTIALAPGAAGDIHRLDLGQDAPTELFLEKGAYLASAESVHCDSKWDGLKGFFNEGFFVLHCSGTGPLFFNAYGAIQEVEVDGSYTVDNGYAVAWEPTLQYRLTKARKIRSFLFSDQLLLSFSGRGRVWVQTRSPRVFSNWVHRYRPVESNNN